jgi:polysaccharide biosynthesis protein PslG
MTAGNGQNVRWRLYLLGAALVFVGMVATFGVAVARSVSVARPSPTSYEAREIPFTDLNPLGANFFLAQEVERWKLERTLAMARDAGIGWVKQHFAWEEIEPEQKGVFQAPGGGSSWAKFDQIIDACETHGLQIVARLDRPPDWAREDNSNPQRPPDDLADYGDFVYAFVERYKGRIHCIQIWNEPNLYEEWGNRPVDPAGYVELLKVAYTRAKQADPNVRVLSAPLAITLGEPHPEPGKWAAMNDLDYLEAMYEAGAAPFFDIYSANAFGMDLPPDDPPDPEVLNFQRVLLHREIMERYGDENKPIWFNEFGWNAAPATMAKEDLIWQRVSEAEQVRYTLDAIDMARSEWPWAGVFMIWYFRQVGNIGPERADYYFRMVDPDFTPRPLYLALSEQAGDPSQPGPGLYQESNPAITLTGDWIDVLDEDSLGRAHVVSSNPGDRAVFRFDGTAVNLFGQRSVVGGRLYVSLDGQAVSGLPTDDEGRSYVDLRGPGESEPARIPLVAEATPGEHRLELEVGIADGVAGLCVVDAFEVLPEERSLPVTWLVGSGVGSALAGWWLWRSWRRLRWVI